MGGSCSFKRHGNYGLAAFILSILSAGAGISANAQSGMCRFYTINEDANLPKTSYRWDWQNYDFKGFSIWGMSYTTTYDYTETCKGFGEQVNDAILSFGQSAFNIAMILSIISAVFIGRANNPGGGGCCSGCCSGCANTCGLLPVRFMLPVAAILYIIAATTGLSADICGEPGNNCGLGIGAIICIVGCVLATAGTICAWMMPLEPIIDDDGEPAKPSPGKPNAVDVEEGEDEVVYNPYGDTNAVDVEEGEDEVVYNPYGDTNE